jgi:signal transduction histidine kinase
LNPVQDTTGPQRPAAGTARADLAFELNDFDAATGERAPAHWIGWRRKVLVFAGLIAFGAALAVLRLLSTSHWLDTSWQTTPARQLTLLGAADPSLAALAGRTLDSVESPAGGRFAVDALAVERSPRWQVDDARRRQQLAVQQRLAEAFATGSVTLHFSDGSRVEVPTPQRGVVGIGLLFWPLAALALLLMLLGAAVVLVRPHAANGLFMLMALCQAGNLWFIAMQAMPGLGGPATLAVHEMLARMAFDGISGAAAVHAFALHPRRLPGATTLGAAAWALVALLLAAAHSDALPHLWWWAQGMAIGFSAAALVVLGVSYRIEPNPFTALMRRFSAVAAVTLVLVTAGAAAASGQPGVPALIAVAGSVVWYLFLSSLMLLVPFLARSKHLLREFAMLAGISTVAASLDLLFVAVFSLGAFTSLALAVFIALGVYAGARQWIIDRVVGSSVLTIEHAFERLYATAREVQAKPERHGTLLDQLLRELFDPLEVLKIDRHAPKARVVGGGSALLVPVRPGDGRTHMPRSLLLRFARRGKRLFTQEDARLAGSIVEQLRRAVAYDQAVERGRAEERQRIAQDLHDDIGARLLTLMYQAQDPAMEEYLRQTLKDLKTLTRGLASSDHRLSFAAAEWKSDLGQRLTVAGVALDWACDFDHDLALSMVEWSAVTRVLRELVSNTLHHAQAGRVGVALKLQQQRLSLSVADDGIGRAPEHWAHGLGLGGVRKRVKLLGGEVRWRENAPRGIVCEVSVPQFGARR